MKKVWILIILSFLLLLTSGCDTEGILTGNNQVSAPVLSPVSGVLYVTDGSPKTVTITTDTDGAVIRYTVGDGSQAEPDADSELVYNGPFSITSSVTVKAKAYHDSLTESDLSTAVYSVVDGRVIISEYVEGSSNNKALEIYNGTGGSIELEDYAVRIYTNGSESPEYIIDLYSGALADGGCWVLTNSSAGSALSDKSDQTSGDLQFNGDDAVELVYKDQYGDVTLDVIGRIGEDPGSYWGSGSAVTKEATLRRKGGVITGDHDGTDSFDPSVEWDGFDQDTFDGLGFR